VRLSICEFTTLGASFEEDLVAYRVAGAEGIGVCEMKLGEGASERLRESGLRATHCIPDSCGAVDPAAAADGGARGA
jgi:hypothetical protein